MYRIINQIFFTLLMVASAAGISSPTFILEDWQEWIKNLKQEAQSRGISAELVDKLFTNLTPNDTVLHLDKKQPEKRLNFEEYKNSRADKYKINLGKQEFQKHKNLLIEISQKYGVDACIITALWGMESSYGRYVGNFNVIRSLATLSFKNRRSNFFRNELLLALQMLNEKHVDENKFIGEWAGATGQPQFLPSSWFKFAIDYDKDGKRDIWNTYSDVFASIANYLLSNGWKSNQPNLLKVSIPDSFPVELINSKQTLSTQKWLELGIKIDENHPKSYLLQQALLIKPIGGPLMLTFKNFDVIMTYNRTVYYAATIDYMAKSICSDRYN